MRLVLARGPNPWGQLSAGAFLLQHLEAAAEAGGHSALWAELRE